MTKAMSFEEVKNIRVLTLDSHCHTENDYCIDLGFGMDVKQVEGLHADHPILCLPSGLDPTCSRSIST